MSKFSQCQNKGISLHDPCKEVSLSRLQKQRHFQNRICTLSKLQYLEKSLSALRSVTTPTAGIIRCLEQGKFRTKCWTFSKRLLFLYSVITFTGAYIRIDMFILTNLNFSSHILKWDPLFFWKKKCFPIQPFNSSHLPEIHLCKQCIIVKIQ